MKHEPIPSTDDLSDDALDRLVASLPPCPGIPSTEAEVAAADARAMADFAAGRVYPHALVKQWIEERRPGVRFKEWVASRHG